MKTCSKCGEEKTLEMFPLASRPRNNGTRARRSECKACYNKRSLAWGRENPEKVNASALAWKQRNRKQHNEYVQKWRKKNRFKVALSLSRCTAKSKGYVPCLATVEEIKTAFTGFCHICGISELKLNRKLCLEHSHENGRFRGWCCDSCNRMLGSSKDSPEMLEKGAAYLRSCEAITA